MFDYSIKDSRPTNIIEKILLHIRNEIRALQCIFTPDSAVLIIDVPYEDDNFNHDCLIIILSPCTTMYFIFIQLYKEMSRNHPQKWQCNICKEIKEWGNGLKGGKGGIKERNQVSM